MPRFERCWLFTVTALSICLLARDAVTPAAARLDPHDSENPRIAVCAVVKIIEELMETDRYKPARVEFEDDLREELLKPIADLMEETKREADGLAEDDPRLRELGERYRSLQRQAQQATQQVVQRVEAKVAEQLGECYETVRSSAVAIAEQRGFNYLIASGDPEDAPKDATVMKMVRDFLARPVLLSPDGADITEDVRADLKLE